MAPSLPVVDTPTAKEKVRTFYKVVGPTSGNLVHGLNDRIGKDIKASDGKYTSALVADVAELRKTSAAKANAADAMFKDPAAMAIFLKENGGKTLPEIATGALGDAGLQGPADALSGIASVASTLTNPNTWLRIGEGLLGLLLITVGVVAITKSTPVGKAATSAATKAAKFIP